MDRTAIAKHIATRLHQEKERLRRDYGTKGQISSCVLDNVLPEDIALQIHAAFPDCRAMRFKDTIRERKYFSAQMDDHHAIVEEAVFAFQHEDVIAHITEITGIRGLEADANLYAGGISSMTQGNYLKPHLDNSHDGKQAKYRAINLLYYVAPDWRADYGGHLELWDEGLKHPPRTIYSSFNRLVLMATNRTSWHSVSTVRHDGARRCVSNYYFCETSPEREDYFHATSFRRPGEHVRDAIMQADNALRTVVLKVTGTKVYKNPHVYRRKTDTSDDRTSVEQDP